MSLCKAESRTTWPVTAASEGPHHTGRQCTGWRGKDGSQAGLCGWLHMASVHHRVRGLVSSPWGLAAVRAETPEQRLGGLRDSSLQSTRQPHQHSDTVMLRTEEPRDNGGWAWRGGGGSEGPLGDPQKSSQWPTCPLLCLHL